VKCDTRNFKNCKIETIIIDQVTFEKLLYDGALITSMYTFHLYTYIRVFLITFAGEHYHYTNKVTLNT